MVRILLAEDDGALNSLVYSSLVNNGYEVKSCFDGKSAYSAFENEQFDMIITDIMMPQMDGFEIQTIHGLGYKCLIHEI